MARQDESAREGIVARICCTVGLAWECCSLAAPVLLRSAFSDLPPPLQLLHGREALLPPKAILYLAVETAPREGIHDHVSAPPHLQPSQELRTS